MTLEATITQLEQTNANLVAEVLTVKQVAQQGADTATQKASEASQSANDSLAAKDAAEELYGDLQAIDTAKTTAETKASEASNSAADALTSKQAAASSETAAAVSLAAIQDTADFYADTSAGIAGTVDTEHFRVLDASGEQVTLYRNDAGVATPLATFMTKAGEDAREAQLRKDIVNLVKNPSEIPVKSVFFEGATGAFIDASTQGA